VRAGKNKMARVLCRVSWQIKDKKMFRRDREIKINEKIDLTFITSSSSQFPRAKYEHSVLLSIHHLSISKYISPHLLQLVMEQHPRWLHTSHPTGREKK
jgi:hypothetical protein